jgi:hypothetical protein
MLQMPRMRKLEFFGGRGSASKSFKDSIFFGIVMD